MLSRWFRPGKKVPAYSRLARVYDFVMRHVPYDEWAEYLIALFAHTNVGVNQILDIACGTGSLLIELKRHDHEIAGFDASPQMVAVARQKFLTHRINGHVWVGSMERFHAKHLYQAVLCTYDSMNYCRDVSTCRAVIEHVARALCPGGLFIFDVTTRQNSKRYFRNYYEREETSEFEVIRRSRYDTNSHIQNNEFWIKWCGEKTCYSECHVQHIFTIDEIMNAIPSFCYKVLGLYDGFSLLPGTENSERVTFVLKKLEGVDG